MALVTLDQISVPLAFAAGLASFLSPCVLPLVPAYIAYLAGPAVVPATGAAGTAISNPAASVAGATGPGAAPRSGEAVANAVAFVGGLSLVFIAFFYVLRTALTGFRGYVGPVAGVFVILMALQTAGLIRLPLVDRELRLMRRAPARNGPAGAVLLGAGFAAGWTPCIGATLGAVLSSGITSGTTAAGLILMVAYCLGLGLPFVLLGAGLERAAGTVRALRRHQRSLNLAAAAVLMAMGFLLLTGNLLLLTQWISRVLPNVPPFGL